MTSSLWCSCHAISLVECSSAWRNSRKNAFASCCLFGKDNDSSISGIWVFKGQELAFELSEDWQIDYASYDWKKLDSKSDECKAQVAQYWKWEGKDAKGREFNQGKILK